MHEDILHLQDTLQKIRERLYIAKQSHRTKFLQSDLSLESAALAIADAYEKGDYVAMKNYAQTILDSQQDTIPILTEPEREFDDLARTGLGFPFPPNWGLPKEIVIPCGTFTIFGARKKTGKSRAMIAAAFHLSLIGKKVVILSCEMPPSQVWLNLWMQANYLTKGNIYSEYDCRAFMQNLKSEKREEIVRFRKNMDDKICVINTRGWTAKRIVYAAKLSENKFGKPADVWAIDYPQIIQPEANDNKFDLRQHHNRTSLYLSDVIGANNVGCIMPSQLSEMGQTSESGNYENDAGCVLNFVRDEDKATGVRGDVMKIIVKYSRSTGGGLFERHLQTATGVITTRKDYEPPRPEQSKIIERSDHD